MLLPRARKSLLSPKNVIIASKLWLIRFALLVKRTPFILVSAIVLIYVILRYKQSLLEVDELRQTLLENYSQAAAQQRNEEKVQQQQRLQTFASILDSKKFNHIKDEKTLKVLAATAKELELTRTVNKTAKVLLLSTWKNGGDFIGDILSRHPHSFYHYEPLAFNGIKRFSTDPDEEALRVVRSLLKCQHGPSLGYR